MKPVGFRGYYEDELAYLRDLGTAFGQANPAIAGLLARQATDPDVERLLEGFAFLTGRLRQRLDQELPELSHGLLALLWPHYLRPIPAMTILQFVPDGAEPVAVPAGAAVGAEPVDGIQCRFRLCQDIEVLPARIVQAGIERVGGGAVLTALVRMNQGAPLAQMGGRRVRMYLHGDRDQRLGPRLLRALGSELAGIEVTSGSESRVLPASALRTVGLDPDAAVLPWPRAAAPGFRLLQEYLAFPEKFQFIELTLPRVLPPRADGVLLRFRLAHAHDLPTRIGAETLRLNCVPVANLYDGWAEPVPLAQDRLEYRLTPDAGGNPLARIHSVERMEGSVQGRADALPIPPFEALRHLRADQSGLYYRLRMRPAVLGRGAEAWVGFVDGADQPMLPRLDVVSTRIVCTDGEIAERVPLGAIRRAQAGSPASMAFHNITPVTPEAPPPLAGDTLWRLIAGLACSRAPLANLDALRALIAAHDFRAINDERQRRRLDLLLEGLVGLRAAPMRRLVQGIPVPGRQITLTVRESGFGGPEGAFLFGEVLDAFIAAHGGLNACHQLVLDGVENRAHFVWSPHTGSATA